eukprot:GFUD01096326.1.p1 GENE.GFUD01096326.1~~GFUD01096326.1.p1  ORF type:complete len:107 (+),score=5.41 GFUD01096326.1:214-534(+)
MFSFNSEYVSLAMECPTDYPYVFHFGKLCTKSPHTWFAEKSSDSYIRCNGYICRTRTGGRLNQKKYLTDLMISIDDSLSAALMHWNLEMALLTLLIVLLMFFYFIY